MAVFKSFCAGELLVQALCAPAIGGMRRSWCVVSSEFINVSILHQACAPTVRISAKYDPFIARRTIRFALCIGHVLFAGCFSQIAPFIVRLVAVGMINKFPRPFAGHHCPHNSADADANLSPCRLDSDMKISVGGFGSCERTDLDAVAAPKLPNKNAFLGIVAEQSAHHLDCRQILDGYRYEFRHEMGLLAGWFSRLVKRPSGVGTLGGFAMIARALG